MGYTPRYYSYHHQFSLPIQVDDEQYMAQFEVYAWQHMQGAWIIHSFTAPTGETMYENKGFLMYNDPADLTSKLLTWAQSKCAPIVAEALTANVGTLTK